VSKYDLINVYLCTNTNTTSKVKNGMKETKMNDNEMSLRLRDEAHSNNKAWSITDIIVL